jgi:hypothetical protein
MSKGKIAKSIAKMAEELSAKAKKPEVSRIDMGYKDVTKRVPELTEAARMVKAGQMTAEQYADLVNKVKPVTPYGFIPKPASAEEAIAALTSNKKAQFGKTSEIKPGEKTDLRLDIPSYSQHGVWVNSIHRKNAPTVYGSVSSVKNAEMIPSPDKAIKVATGETPKSPFAVIRGEWNPMEEEAAVEAAQKYLKHEDWRQVGYDPERHGYFYDRETMAPIVGADEVIQIGPLVLAKKPRYGSQEDFPFKAGGAVKMQDGGSIKASPPKPGQEFLGKMGKAAEKLGIKLEEAMKIVSQEGNSPIKAALTNFLISDTLKSAGTALQDWTGTPRDATEEFPYRRLMTGKGMTAQFDPRLIDVAPIAGSAAGRVASGIKHLPTDVMKAALAAYGPRATASPMDVWHAGPHKFPPTKKNPLGEFDPTKIGTGEGAQAFGYGHYVAQNPSTAKYYGEKLRMASFGYDGKKIEPGTKMSDAIEYLWNWQGDKAGALSDAAGDPAMQKMIKSLDYDKIEMGPYTYKVDLPDEQIVKMLDWDKPLDQQPEIRKALEGTDYQVGISEKEAEKLADARLRNEANDWADETGGDPVDYINNANWEKYVAEEMKNAGGINANTAGKDLHDLIMKDSGYRRELFDPYDYQVDTSETLRSFGIPGIKYLDQASRQAGEGTRNFVVFPGMEDILTIKERMKKGGAVRKADGGIMDAIEAAKAAGTAGRPISMGRQPIDIEQMRREVEENARRVAAVKKELTPEAPIEKKYSPALKFLPEGTPESIKLAFEKAAKDIGPSMEVVSVDGKPIGVNVNEGGFGYLLSTASSLYDIPATVAGEEVFRRTGSPALAAAAYTLADPIGAVMGAPAVGRAAIKGAKALAPNVERMAENYMVKSGLMPHIFIGWKSPLWNVEAGKKAVELEKAGVAPVDIWKQTGTFRSPDGDLRQEISDVGSKFRGEKEMKELVATMKQQEADIKQKIKESKEHPDLFPKQLKTAQGALRQAAKEIKQIRTMEGGPEYRVGLGNKAGFAFEHPELYEAYPKLLDMNVQQGGRSGSAFGSYTRGINESDPGMVNIYDRGLANDPRSTMIHETQHAIQNIEGWGRGGNTAMAFQNPEAHKILEDLRKEARTPLSFDDWYENIFKDSAAYHFSAGKDINKAKKLYEDYVANIPALAKKYDRDYQEQAARLYYKRLAGEAESRAAQARRDLTPEQRLEKFPLEVGDYGYDVKPEDIIVKRNKKGGQVSLDAMRLAVGGMAGGGKLIGEVVKGLSKGAQKGAQYTAVDRARAGIDAAEMIKRQEQIRASEALGQLMEKGIKKVSTTQSDRTRVGGGNIGGANFPAISLVDPEYAGKVWGVGDNPTAARLINLSSPETAWTTMLGSANQLKTNPVVFDRMKRQFMSGIKAGKLSSDLEKKINKNLELTFGEGASIRDPKIWKEADTFEKRSALADIMMGQGIPPSQGGVALGGEKSGKGVIFKPSEILTRETEPLLLHPEHGGDVPTYALGPRLFSLGKETYYRPDLHPGFPRLIEGKDFGFNVRPTPTEVFLPEWHKRFKEKFPERKAPPGYYDLSLGLKGEGLPSQELSDEYIRHLLREGFKEGGPVHKSAGGILKSLNAMRAFVEAGKKAKLAEKSREAAAKGEVYIPDEEAKKAMREALQQSMPEKPEGFADGGQITSDDLIIEERAL